MLAGVCDVYKAKEVASFWGASPINGDGAKKYTCLSKLQSTDQQKDSGRMQTGVYKQRNSIKMKQKVTIIRC